MASANKIMVEIAYARPDEQVIIPLSVALGVTVNTAILESKILERFPEIDVLNCKVGIFGKLSKLDKELSEGDRVEIYRPLIADPKAVRKKRANTPV